MLRVSSSLLQHRRAPFWLACIGSLLALPSLFGGLQGDDYYHRAVLRGEVRYTAYAPTRFRMFTFHNGDPARTLTAIDEGLAVWWVDPHLKVDFLRPGSVITHMVDYALWPRTPWLMHLHSIGWFAACVLLMTHLLRRLFLHVRHASWVAGLAALPCGLSMGRTVFRWAGWRSGTRSCRPRSRSRRSSCTTALGETAREVRGTGRQWHCSAPFLPAKAL